MFAKVSGVLSSTTPEVKIEHKGKSIPFSISVFGRVHFQQEYEVFHYINQYWASLDEAHQDRIFKLYEDIEYGFDNIYSKDDLCEHLTNKVTELIQEHDMDKVQDWISFKSDIQIPAVMEIDYTHSIDNNTSREKTYTRSDYLQLVTLSVVIKCMIPIWGQYIFNIRRDTGSQYKEFYAFQLLSHSNIAHCVPMNKLRLYIENIVGEDKYNPNNTLNGISSEDFGYWLLALLCIRRLGLGDIRGTDPKIHLITFSYKYIIQKIRNNDSNFENVVKEKTFDDRSPDGENKISTLERYKIKTNISLGEIVELEYSIQDIRHTAHKLSYRIDPQRLERSLVTSQELLPARLLDPQITLLRWVFKHVITPKGLMYLPKPVIVQALGAMEAVLWARGHKYLAILATCYPLVSGEDMVISPVDSKMRVPKEMSDELDRLYPFTRSTNSKRTGIKEINLAAKSIDTMADNLTMYSWRSTADESMLQEVFGNTNRKFPIRPDIKLELTKLVIEIGNRTWS